MRQIPDSLAPARRPGLGFRVMLEACLRHDGWIHWLGGISPGKVIQSEAILLGRAEKAMCAG